MNAKKNSKKGFRFAIGVAVASLGVASFVAQANLDTGEGRLFPYQGHLERNGLPISEFVDVRFALTSNSDATLDCLVIDNFTPPNSAACGLWWEERANILVSSGSFAVALGEEASLSDAVLAQPQLHLAIAIRGVGDTAFTLLPGTQRLLAVPFANRAAAANNYTVAGSLDVGGSVDINGSVDVNGGLSVNGSAGVGESIVVNANANALMFSNVWSAFGDQDDSYAEISNDTDNFNALMLVGNRSESGTTRNVQVYDNLYVNGTTDFNGDVTGLTVTTGTCATQSDTRCELIGEIHFLDRQNNVRCPINTFMRSFNVINCGGGTYRMDYDCCSLNVR